MPSASVGITWVRYPLPAQRSAAAVAVADKALSLHAGLSPEACASFPEDVVRRWLERRYIGLGCSVQCREGGRGADRDFQVFWG